MDKEKWNSKIPTHCDVCRQKIRNTFVDGKTVFGPWGIMCPLCYLGVGVGLGLGKGQRYMKKKKEFVKVAG